LSQNETLKRIKQADVYGFNHCEGQISSTPKGLKIPNDQKGKNNG
jgi:hypothetical protein